MMKRALIWTCPLMFVAVGLTASTSSAQHLIYHGHGDHHYRHGNSRAGHRGANYGHSHAYGHVHGHFDSYHGDEHLGYPVYPHAEFYPVPAYTEPGYSSPVCSSPVCPDNAYGGAPLNYPVPPVEPYGQAGDHDDHSHPGHLHDPPSDQSDHGYVAQPSLTTSEPTVGTMSTISEAYRHYAEQAFKAGDFANAARYANHAVIEAPQDGELLTFFSETLFAAAEFQSASSVLRQAASLSDPSQWNSWLASHRQIYPSGTYDEKLAQLDQYIVSHPDDADAYFLRGVHLGAIGQQDEAVRDLNKSIALTGSDPVASKLLQQFRAGPSTAKPNVDAPIQIDGPPPSLDPGSSDSPDHDHSHEGHSHR